MMMMMIHYSLNVVVNGANLLDGGGMEEVNVLCHLLATSRPSQSLISRTPTITKKQ
jgi:hypothetical protein